MNPNPALAEQRPDYGVRLSQAEYERRLVALYSGGPPLPSEAQTRKRDQIELHLLVDYHLGMEFPKSRREQLWQAKQKLDARRGWHLFLGLLTRPWDAGSVMMRAQVREFSQVLNAAELLAFLDLSPEDLKKLQ